MDAYQREWDMTSNDITRHAIHDAAEGEHVLHRSITEGVDQVLTLGGSGKHEGELRVATNEYAIIEEMGGWYCDCGLDFDTQEDAEAHLRDAREGTL